MERDENRTEAKTSSDTRPGSLLDPIRMRRKVQLKIFRMKTFGSKPLQREPKRGSDNFVRVRVLGVSSACRASIENVFENFKSPNCGSGDLAGVARCACARKCACAAPIEPRAVPLRRFRSPTHLTGPFEGTFVRASTTLSNRKRSTKVPFPNIPGSESWKFKARIWVENLKRCKRVPLILFQRK